MHTEGQPLTRKVLHHRFEVGELGDESRPAVDDQEDVAERIGRRGMVRILAQLPVRRDRPHPVLLENALALSQNSFHLCDNAVHPVGFGSGGHPADVRKILQVHQAATAEVDTVELDLAWRVRRGRRQHQRLQEGRLSGLRGPADCDVAARRGNIDTPHLLAMPARLVHDAEPESQRLTLVVPLDQLVDRCRIGQRRQPHSVRAHLARRQLVQYDLAQYALFGFDGHDITAVSKIGAAVN